MKFTGSVGEERQVIIPQDVMDLLRVEPGASVQIEIQQVPDFEPLGFDPKQFNAAIELYLGSKRDRLLADGYSSVDELMEDIRPRW